MRQYGKTQLALPIGGCTTPHVCGAAGIVTSGSLASSALGFQPSTGARDGIVDSIQSGTGARGGTNQSQSGIDASDGCTVGPHTCTNVCIVICANDTHTTAWLLILATGCGGDLASVLAEEGGDAPSLPGLLGLHIGLIIALLLSEPMAAALLLTKLRANSDALHLTMLVADSILQLAKSRANTSALLMAGPPVATFLLLIEPTAAILLLLLAKPTADTDALLLITEPRVGINALLMAGPSVAILLLLTMPTAPILLLTEPLAAYLLLLAKLRANTSALLMAGSTVATFLLLIVLTTTILPLPLRWRFLLLRLLLCQSLFLGMWGRCSILARALLRGVVLCVGKVAGSVGGAKTDLGFACEG